MRAISGCIEKKNYDEIVPSEYRKYTGEDHYTWCVSYVIALAESTMTEISQDQKLQHPFEFVFSWMEPRDKRRAEIDEVMAYSERAYAEDFGVTGIYTNYSFRSPKDLPGLQCVDAIGWTCYRYALSLFPEPPPEPKFARSAWENYEGDCGPDGWLRAFTFTRSKLKDWVEKDQADGRTINVSCDGRLRIGQRGFGNKKNRS